MCLVERTRIPTTCATLRTLPIPATWCLTPQTVPGAHSDMYDDDEFDDNDGDTDDDNEGLSGSTLASPVTKRGASTPPTSSLVRTVWDSMRTCQSAGPATIRRMCPGVAVCQVGQTFENKLGTKIPKNKKL